MKVNLDELYYICDRNASLRKSASRYSLTNSCPSVDVLSIVGIRSNKSKNFFAADRDLPICRPLY